MAKGFSDDLFAGKTVVITGAGRGIGLAAADLFVALGARVIAHAGRFAKAAPGSRLEAAANDGRARLFAGDFTKTADIDAFAAAVAKITGTVHVLVNNAGTMAGRFPAADLTDAQYDAIVTLNQTSVVHMTRALIPLLASAGNAAIINTSSISARTGGSPGSAIYSAAKAFVSTYTRAMARELAPKGIRVNAVSPGTIDTDFHARYSSPAKLEAARQTIPLARLGTADDCASAFVFLAAPELSGYITGQVIEVNGGQLMA